MLPELGWIDWSLLAVLGASVAVGLWRGFTYEVLALLGWVAAYVAAQAFSPLLAPSLPIGSEGSALNQAAAFVLSFVLALVVWALAARLISLLVGASPLGPANRVLGAGFGLLRGLVLLLALATAVALTPLARSADWQASHGAGWLNVLLDGLAPVLPTAIAQHLPGGRAGN